MVLLADFTNLNWRLVSSFIPATPNLINTWVGGDVMASVRRRFSWQWGLECMLCFSIKLYSITWMFSSYDISCKKQRRMEAIKS